MWRKSGEILCRIFSKYSRFSPQGFQLVLFVLSNAEFLKIGIIQCGDVPSSVILHCQDSIEAYQLYFFVALLIEWSAVPAPCDVGGNFIQQTYTAGKNNDLIESSAADVKLFTLMQFDQVTSLFSCLLARCAVMGGTENITQVEINLIAWFVWSCRNFLPTNTCLVRRQPQRVHQTVDAFLVGRPRSLNENRIKTNKQQVQNPDPELQQKTADQTAD